MSVQYTPKEFSVLFSKNHYFKLTERFALLKQQLSIYLFAAPIFTSVPSIVARDDGHVRVVGCKYNANADLKQSSFLLINGSHRVVNLYPPSPPTKGIPDGNAVQSYELPETFRLTSGFYQCGFDLTTANAPILSNRSKFVPWPCKYSKLSKHDIVSK